MSKLPADPGQNIVAKIIEIKQLGQSDSSGYLFRNERWYNVQLPTLAKIEKWRAVNAVMLRKINGADHLAVTYEGMPLRIGDVLKTGPECVMAIAFVLGGRVGINRASTVEVVTERSVTDHSQTIMKILLRQGGIWAKVATQTQPRLIQMTGGVMGGKG